MNIKIQCTANILSPNDKIISYAAIKKSPPPQLLIHFINNKPYSLFYSTAQIYTALVYTYTICPTETSLHPRKTHLRLQPPLIPRTVSPSSPYFTSSTYPTRARARASTINPSNRQQKDLLSPPSQRQPLPAARNARLVINFHFHAAKNPDKKSHSSRSLKHAPFKSSLSQYSTPKLISTLSLTLSLSLSKK